MARGDGREGCVDVEEGLVGEVGELHVNEYVLVVSRFYIVIVSWCCMILSLIFYFTVKIQVQTHGKIKY